jgi:ornithine cyclodeaminase/alanine dehydrogenase-like protein (mu-crystallin family)
MAGSKPGRENAGERIMAMNLGLAIEDVATASNVFSEGTESTGWKNVAALTKGLFMLPRTGPSFS